MQQLNSAELLAKPMWQLKQYINAYHLSAKGAIEKDGVFIKGRLTYKAYIFHPDLVRIIINTRPLSNESEIFYRNNRTQLASTQRQQSQNRGPYQQQTSPMHPQPPFSSRQQPPQSQPRPQPQPQSRPQPPPPSPQSQPQPQPQSTTWPFQSRPQPPGPSYPPPPQQPYTTSQPYQHPNPPPQQAQQQQQARPSQSSPSNTASVLSLDDIVRNNIDPSSLSVRILKDILRTNFVEQSHVLEKSELVGRVQRLVDERRTKSEVKEESMCILCCDAQQNCVFLDCGHMVACMDCGKQNDLFLVGRNEKSMPNLPRADPEVGACF
ncbi:hypothetical protein EC973_001697 [Apophysomyces ossiformis]|uniref:Uncharacterized protein n=1 Tax=Apophysomyces ossiformis TaxID=679940 RepID=A0A8H7BHM4_9FUNG|nr:hypothetical protein EC973_001697 [Apophysomyces ossiformis]